MHRKNNMAHHYIYIFEHIALKDLSNGVNDELQVFLHEYSSSIENVLEKCLQVSQFYLPMGLFPDK